jgi:hypothetical protein
MSRVSGACWEVGERQRNGVSAKALQVGFMSRLDELTWPASLQPPQLLPCLIAHWLGWRHVNSYSRIRSSGKQDKKGG